jgi:hypothetical protein
MNKSSQILSEGRKDISISNISDVNIDLLINKVDGENSPKWFGITDTLTNEASPINMFQAPNDGSASDIVFNANNTNTNTFRSKHRKHQSMSILPDKVHEEVYNV